jgi:hypothetical protein
MTQYSGKVIRKTPVTPTQTSASGVWKLNEQAAAIRNNSWPVPGVPDPISRSVRLRSSASAYFNRTPSVSGNQKTWTWSAWVKLGSLSAYEYIFTAGTLGSTTSGLYYDGTSNGVFGFLMYPSYPLLASTTPVYRDPAAWYHVVLAVDTTQASIANGLRLWVNGVLQSWSGSPTYTQNTNTYQNSASYPMNIGRNTNSQANYFDGYLTEVNFIDGQALTPSSFGTTDVRSGAWIPMPYTGTYGTNGFYLNFSNNTDTNTIGYDYSGNSNNWQSNNISLTAGVTYDSMLDVPTPWVGYTTTTDTSAVVRGNYAVLSPIDTAGTAGSIAAGNLNLTGGSAAWYQSRSGFGMTSGKWYWEVTILSANTASNGIDIGIANSSAQSPGFGQANNWVYNNNTGGTGRKNLNGTTSSYGVTYVANDVVGVAFDADAGSITFYVNNSSQGVMASTGLPNPAFPNVQCYGTDSVAVNFGQRPLTYSPPAGFKTLCTTNLPMPTITNGANYMAASTYTGNGGTQSIVNSGNNTAAISFKPDLVWAKSRNGTAQWNVLADSVRGAGYWLSSNSTNAEAGPSQLISAFNSNGFSVNVSPNNTVNASGENLVGWQWQAGAGTSSSNTSGSITSTVSVNTTAGFSVVTYTGNGIAGATVGHGLGVSPSFIVVKKRNASGTSWLTYHTGLTSNQYYLQLNSTAAQTTGGVNTWTISSSTVGLYSYTDINNNGDTYVMYCWAAVPGYSAFGSYTGNGSADGPFVYCGFRPRFVMIKNASATADWKIMDTSRDLYNPEISTLAPDSSAAEDANSSYAIDYLSNGFKIRNTFATWNGSGNTLIYAAFAENPFKYSNAR